MEGIDFLVDSTGKKTKVLIDLEKYQDNLEDAFDIIIAVLSKDEPSFTLAEVKADLIKAGKLK